jgi:hypothetical protein
MQFLTICGSQSAAVLIGHCAARSGATQDSIASKKAFIDTTVRYMNN